MSEYKWRQWDFPGGIKDLPCKAGDADSNPDLGTKILHAMEKLSLWATTTEPTDHN